MSEFNRPPGIVDGQRSDPEEQYRAGFQHGAAALLSLLRTDQPKSLGQIERWIQEDLQNWRHDKTTSWKPPAFRADD